MNFWWARQLWVCGRTYGAIHMIILARATEAAFAYAVISKSAEVNRVYEYVVAVFTLLAGREIRLIPKCDQQTLQR